MDGKLQYQIELENADAIAAIERFNAASAQMAAKIDGIRTTSGGADTASSSFFDKVADAGSKIANTVAGLESLGKVLTWLKGAQTAAAVSAQAGTAANSLLGAASRAAGAGAVVGAAGIGLFGGAAAAAAVSVGVLMTALGVLLPVIAAGSLAISGFTGTLAGLKRGIGLANTFEQTSIAFRTLTGDVEQAKAVMTMLSQMAIDTPFNEADLQGGARALLAARVPASMLKQELKAIGNIASATNGDIGRLATVYAQVAGKGKLYAEELQQFVEQGAGELRQAVASTLGVTTGQLMELMQKGEVGFSVLQTAIQSLAGETGKWGDAMSAQSNTNLGLLSSLSDNFGKILRLLSTPIAEGPIKAFLQSAVAISSEVATTLAAAMEEGRVGEFLGLALIMGAKMGYNGFMDVLDKLKQETAAWAMQNAKMIGDVLSGNFSSALSKAALIMSSFDKKSERFDLAPEKAGMAKIVGDAKESALGRRREKFATDLDSVPGADPSLPDLPALPKTAEAARKTVGLDPLTPKGLKAMGLPSLPQTPEEAAKMLADPDRPVPGVPQAPRFTQPPSLVNPPAAEAATEPGTDPATPREPTVQAPGGATVMAPKTGAPATATVPIPASPGRPAAAVPQIPLPTAPPIEAAARVAADAGAKIQGYSREKQGGVAAANARAAQRMADARSRIAQAYNPQPAAAAVQAAVTPGARTAGAGSAGAEGGGAGGGSASMISKLEEIKGELQRIRTK